MEEIYRDTRKPFRSDFCTFHLLSRFFYLLLEPELLFIHCWLLFYPMANKNTFMKCDPCRGPKQAPPRRPRRSRGATWQSSTRGRRRRTFQEIFHQFAKISYFGQQWGKARGVFQLEGSLNTPNTCKQKSGMT